MAKVGRKRNRRPAKPRHAKPEPRVIDRAVEREYCVGPTIETVQKQQITTIARLVKSREIGHLEERAIDEIERVYMHLCAGLIVRGAPLGEKLDKGSRVEPVWFVDAHQRYKEWADLWSRRWKLYRDPTLKIVMDVLFSDATLGSVAAENQIDHRKATAAFIGGIRDYAAIMGLPERHAANQWRSAAFELFAGQFRNRVKRTQQRMRKNAAVASEAA